MPSSSPKNAFPEAKIHELKRPVSEPILAPNGVYWLPVPGWERYPWLRAGFSTRKGGQSRAYCAHGSSNHGSSNDGFSNVAPGELNLGFTPDDDPEVVRCNRALFTEAVAGRRLPLVALRQIHSTQVLRSSHADALVPAPCEGDGHFTADQGLMLGVQTADCIPVLVADKKKKIVAGFHAGWRGTVQRIVELGIPRLREACGSEPADLMAAIGPGAGPCCYAVNDEVIQAFTAQFDYAAELFHRVRKSAEAEPNIHLDLIEANRKQLLAAGLKAEAIQIVAGCTNCQTDLYFSHRVEGGRTGRMMALIGMVPRYLQP